MSETRRNDCGGTPSDGQGVAAERAMIDSRDLLRGNREVLIRHGSEIYRLLVTRNDKLILQK